MFAIELWTSIKSTPLFRTIRGRLASISNQAKPIAFHFGTSVAAKPPPKTASEAQSRLTTCLLSRTENDCSCQMCRRRAVTTQLRSLVPLVGVKANYRACSCGLWRFSNHRFKNVQKIVLVFRYSRDCEWRDPCAVRAGSYASSIPPEKLLQSASDRNAVIHDCWTKLLRNLHIKGNETNGRIYHDGCAVASPFIEVRCPVRGRCVPLALRVQRLSVSSCIINSKFISPHKSLPMEEPSIEEGFGRQDRQPSR